MFNAMTFGRIKMILTADAYKAFEKWMDHQTVMVNEDVQYVYAHDFERWVKENLGRRDFTTEQGADWD